MYTWKYHDETLCVSTFISNKQKCHYFSFIFSAFSSTIWENRRAEQVLWRVVGEVGTSGRGEVAGNRRVKTKMCKNVYICM
jgi:hypothetical protein